MEKIKVIEAARYRDGGTIEYHDAEGKIYYMWNPHHPHPENKTVWSKIGRKGEILPVELEEVKRF